ncbi:hypothetical protein BJM29_12920 [Listeria monocytogenes]|uniref:hypothetical protein n=1 Tax=Listeria monocytogenes TaxID=1639 RepID=UPI0008759526|nr:hypothetical protein [Listeria monocytogenes]OFF72320.1 hypothetical protein BJM29_12920 [Listeria monocytogenes]OFF89214.1 hypothetical protein BJM52_14210 [Listeria monocytogenes]
MFSSKKQKNRDIERELLAEKHIFEIDYGFKTTTVELHDSFIKVKKWGLANWRTNDTRKKECNEKIISFANLSGFDYKPKSNLLLLIVAGSESSNNALNGANSITYGKKDLVIIEKLIKELESRILQ